MVLDGGRATTVWNRTPGKAGGLVERGANPAASIAEAVGASSLVVACLLDHASVHDALGSAVEAALGGIDLLFVNVGYAEFEPLLRVTEESFDRMVRVNVKGAFFTLQRLAPLVRPGGAIVLTTAALVGMGLPASSVATACKRRWARSPRPWRASCSRGVSG